MTDVAVKEEKKEEREEDQDLTWNTLGKVLTILTKEEKDLDKKNRKLRQSGTGSRKKKKKLHVQIVIGNKERVWYKVTGEASDGKGFTGTLANTLHDPQLRKKHPFGQRRTIRPNEIVGRQYF